MNCLSESHLLKIHSYLTKHFYDRKGVHAIRNDVFKKYIQPRSDSFINVEKVCSHCFTFWSEGNFTLKFKSIRIPRKRRNEPVIKKWVLKCLICFKYSTFKCMKTKDSTRLKSNNEGPRVLKSFNKTQKSKSVPQSNHKICYKKKNYKKTGTVIPINRPKCKETRKTALDMLHDLL